MTPEAWERIKASFEIAESLEGTARLEYLEQLRIADPIVHSAVIKLLAAHDDASGFLETFSLTHEWVFRIGELIDNRFQVISRIRRGGIGEVYEVYDQKLRQKRALKTLRTQFAADPQAVERFRREIGIAQKVWHENLCRVYDLIEHRRVTEAGEEQITCLTMELLEGQSLLVYLEEHGTFQHAEALPVIRQIASGLQALHQARIIHRDLKPSNIIICPHPDGTLHAVVTDFGLAKPADMVDPDLFETKLQYNAGAPYYMAPELLRGERPTIASDIYALGLVIDEMVTQCRAYSAQTLEQLFIQKLWSVPALPSQRNSSLPAYWDAVILRCIDVRPEERYQSPREVIAALEGEQVSNRAPVPGAVPELTAPAPPSPRRVRAPIGERLSRRTVVMACVGAPVIAGVSAAVMATRPIDTSVVVFPIENDTEDIELGRLCKGTALEMQRRLSLLDGVRVIPFYESRQHAPSRLPADYSLVALMQAHGTQMRLTFQLIRNQTGDLVWIESFERDRVQNHLTLQNEIAAGTARALEGNLLKTVYNGWPRQIAPFAMNLRRLLGMQIVTAAGSPTNDPIAMERYVRARGLLLEQDLKATEEAENCLLEATQRDPKFALAFSGLADCQFMLMEYNPKPGPELMQVARSYAQKGVQLGPDLPETHATLAAIEQMNWEWELTDFHYARALTLNPGFARGRRWYAGFLIQFGRFEEGLEHSRRAISLDPFDPNTKTSVGLYLFYAGRNDEAIEMLESAVSRKELPIARLNLGGVYAYLASWAPDPASSPWLAKAMQQADRVAEMENARPVARQHLSYSDRMYCLNHAIAGNRRAMQPYFDRMLVDMRAGRTSGAQAATIYAALGETDTALSLLEQSVEARDRKVMYLKVNPFLEKLRDQERFQRMLVRMRL